MIQRRKVGIVGVGNVGVAAAYALFYRHLASDIVLLDRDEKRAEGGDRTVLAHLVEVILGDQKSVLPVSVRLQGEYGIDGICLSIPCVVGIDGVEGRVPLEITPEEL